MNDNTLRVIEEITKLAEDHKHYGSPFAWVRHEGRKFLAQVEGNLGIPLGDFELEVLELSYEVLGDLKATLYFTNEAEYLAEITQVVRDLLPLTNWPSIRALYADTLRRETEDSFLHTFPRSGHAILGRVLENVRATARAEREQHEAALARLEETEVHDQGVD